MSRKLDSIGKVTTKLFHYKDDFCLKSGEKLTGFTLSYETYGKLNASGDNAILLFHALSGNQHAAGFNDDKNISKYWQNDCEVGWWDDFVGPGKALDTDKFFVICANYIGGCYGSTGPSSINPKSGKHFAGNFPHIHAVDVVRSQEKLITHLGIDCLHAVVGGSVGGLLTIAFATNYPNRVRLVVPIAASFQISALQKLTILEQIWAIENDPHFSKGFYYDKKKQPYNGIALARIISHKTFISLETMAKRASKEISHPENIFSWYKIKEPLESYILYQGQKFVPRFDANSYLRILEMWMRFDLLAEIGAKNTTEVFIPCQHQKYLVFSIDSDVCFYPEDQAHLVQILKNFNIQTMHITVHSEKGHDSFLLEPNLFAPHLSFVLNGGL